MMKNEKISDEQDRSDAKQQARLLKLLGSRVKQGFAFKVCEGKIAIKRNDRVHHFHSGLVTGTCREKLVLKQENTLMITDEGINWLKHFLQNGTDAAQSAVSCVSRFDQSKTNPKTPIANVAESPLARLYARKNPDGKKFLSPHEYEAGERLRRDFESGQLQPRTTANWSAYGAGGGGSQNGARTVSDVSDFALDSRSRVNEAIATLAPELAGVALDICCFLKGFELVERERRWPPRSAKLMLRTALCILSRHYGFAPRNHNHGHKILGWGGEGYRPAIGPAVS